MPSNCQILSLKKKVKELSDRERRDRTKTENQVFWLQLLCFSVPYYKPLVLHFWSPYWLEIKCLAKIDWYIGDEAYCPSSLWSLQKSKIDEELWAQENIFSLELLGIWNKLLRQLGSYDCMAGANLKAFIGLWFPWYYRLNQEMWLIFV